MDILVNSEQKKMRLQSLVDVTRIQNAKNCMSCVKKFYKQAVVFDRMHNYIVTTTYCGLFKECKWILKIRKHV